jgi:hypothetical protein
MTSLRRSLLREGVAIGYVAYNQQADEMTICEILTAHYGIDKVNALPARLYQDAIEYLVDLKISNIVN